MSHASWKCSEIFVSPSPGSSRNRHSRSNSSRDPPIRALSFVLGILNLRGHCAAISRSSSSVRNYLEVRESDSRVKIESLERNIPTMSQTNLCGAKKNILSDRTKNHRNVIIGDKLWNRIIPFIFEPAENLSIFKSYIPLNWKRSLIYLVKITYNWEILLTTVREILDVSVKKDARRKR